MKAKKLKLELRHNDYIGTDSLWPIMLSIGVIVYIIRFIIIFIL